MGMSPYVVLVFKKVFAFDEPTARKHMLEVLHGADRFDHVFLDYLRGKGIKGVRASYPGDLYCHIVVETPVKLSEHQRRLLRELDESFKKGGSKHSPSGDSWTDRLKSFFS